MNISWITPNGFPELGGDIMIVDKITQGMASRGNHVKWICRHYENTKDEEYLGKVKVERISIPKVNYGRSLWFSLFGMRQIMQKIKDSDILQYDTFIGSYTDWITKKISGKPAVLLVYGLMIEFWKEFSNSRLEKLFLPKIESVIPKLPFDMFITPCDFTRDTMIKYRGNEDKIKRIYLGVDHDFFHKIKMEDDGKFTIGYLGRMNSMEKNVKCLIDAFRIVKDNIDNSVLNLAGPGFDSQKNNIIKSGLKIGKDVIEIGSFKNHNSKQVRWYSKLDVFASASLIEGFGLPFIEAQACGTPVVCFNRTSMPEVVKQNKTGLLVDEITPEALANALIDSYNKNLKKKFGPNCIKWAKQFTWDKTVDEYLKLYEGLIK